MKFVILALRRKEFNKGEDKTIILIGNLFRLVIRNVLSRFSKTLSVKLHHNKSRISCMSIPMPYK